MFKASEYKGSKEVGEYLERLEAEERFANVIGFIVWLGAVGGILILTFLK